MKKPWVILLVGLTVCLLACWAVSYASTAKYRAALKEEVPELAWLRMEFDLSDEEYRQVASLHNEHVSKCEEICLKVDAAKKTLAQQVEASAQLTPEMEKQLEEMAELRLECQKIMITHYLAVSKTLEPEKGERYLAWVQSHTFLASTPTHDAFQVSPHGSAHGSTHGN